MGPSGPRALLVSVDRFASLSARGLHLRSRSTNGSLASDLPARGASATIAEGFVLPCGVPARGAGRFGPLGRLSRRPLVARRRALGRVLLEALAEPFHDLRRRSHLARRDIGQRALPALAPGRPLGLHAG